jgi:hypothetical protein
MAAVGRIFDRPCNHQSDFLRIKQSAEKISRVQQTLISSEFFCVARNCAENSFVDEPNMLVAYETARDAFAAADLSTARYTLR